MSLKKILAVAMCATVVSATGAMMASAEDAVNLMPGSASDVTATGGATVTYEGGKLVVKAGDQAADVSWNPGKTYDLVGNQYLYFTVDSDKGWDLKFTGKSLNEITPGVVADFGNDEELGVTDLANGMVSAGSFEDKGVHLYGAYDFNKALNDEGTVEAKLITLKVPANGTVTLSSLYAGAEDTTAPDNSGNGGGTVADNNNTNTTNTNTNNTTKKPNPSTGESTAMVASGIVLAVVSAGAVALTMKKKAQ